MGIKKKILLLFAMLIVTGLVVNAQIPDDVISGLREGNAAKLSKNFNQNIELLVLDYECSCSKSQAQQVVNDFFVKYPPTKFTIIHEGGKGDSNYAIGSLETPNGKYRVYFLIKTINKVSFIHQLRIEVQSD
jgi:hypothetical protein